MEWLDWVDFATFVLGSILGWFGHKRRSRPPLLANDAEAVARGRGRR